MTVLLTLRSLGLLFLLRTGSTAEALIPCPTPLLPLAQTGKICTLSIPYSTSPYNIRLLDSYETGSTVLLFFKGVFGDLFPEMKIWERAGDVEKLNLFMQEHFLRAPGKERWDINPHNTFQQKLASNPTVRGFYGGGPLHQTVH